MEEFYSGLRKIKTRSDNFHTTKWWCGYAVFGGALLGLVFPPAHVISAIGGYLYAFLFWRLSLSSCPRCGEKFYSPMAILFGGAMYTKTGMFCVECANCHLALSELPEVEGVDIKNDDDAWRK